MIIWKHYNQCFSNNKAVYDVTNRESFDHIGSWLSEVDIYSTHADVTKLLVGNKIDKVCEVFRASNGVFF